MGLRRGCTGGAIVCAICVHACLSLPDADLVTPVSAVTVLRVLAGAGSRHAGHAVTPVTDTVLVQVAMLLRCWMGPATDAEACHGRTKFRVHSYNFEFTPTISSSIGTST